MSSTEQEFAKAERTVPGQRSPHNGSQAGNPGAAQEREKDEERELNMEGKDLNNLGLVTSPLGLSFLLCKMVTLIGP